MRQAHHARHHVVAGLHLDLDRADGRGDPDDGAVGDRALGEVGRVHVELVPRPALGQPRRVVHPGVVVALVPPPDEQQPVGRDRRRRRAGRGRRAPAAAPRAIRPSSVSSRSGRHGSSGPRSTGPRRSRRTDSRGCRRAQQQVDGAGRGHPHPRRLHQPRLAGPPGGEQPLGAQHDLAVDLPVVHRARRLLEQRRGEPRRVAHGQGVEHQVVVVALQRRRSAAGSRRRAGWSR